MLYSKIEREVPEDLSQISRALLACEGYLFLGDYKAATAELDSVSDSPVGYLCVVELALIRVLLHCKNWEEALDSALLWRSKFPEEPEFVAQIVFSLHQLGRGKRATEVLEAIDPDMDACGSVQYDLACYEAILGTEEAARLALAAAISLNPKFKRSWKKDPDLERLK